MENSSFPMLHGKSKDSIIFLSIPEPVCSKLHLFANIVSMFDTLPSNAKQRDSAVKMIRDYLSKVNHKSLFLISRKNEKETHDSRYYDTNPNGLCGGISLFQLGKRHHHRYSSSKSMFKNTALDFHDSSCRDDFINFLQKNSTYSVVAGKRINSEQCSSNDKLDTTKILY